MRKRKVSENGVDEVLLTLLPKQSTQYLFKDIFKAGNTIFTIKLKEKKLIFNKYILNTIYPKFYFKKKNFQLKRFFVVARCVLLCRMLTVF